jgi:hypothetical protein
VGDLQGGGVDDYLTGKREEGREYLKQNIRRFTTSAGISEDQIQRLATYPIGLHNGKTKPFAVSHYVCSAGSGAPA